jgi:tRNA G10  N-methylase Trm11
LVWKGEKFSINIFFVQDTKIYKEQSPHNRMFKIYDTNGAIKDVYGYRGAGSEFGSRALPVEDARCMVNLSQPGKNKRMIDPFAGGGGIIYQFKYMVPDGTMISVDIDPVLKPGLEYYGAVHYVQNAKEICLTADSFDSVITEVPFSLNALDDINSALQQLTSFIAKNGVFIIMCGKKQSSQIQKTMEETNNYLLYKHEIDRKGTEVEIQIWHRSKNNLKDIISFINILNEIK